MHKLICSVGMMIVALLAGALGARGQGAIVWTADSVRRLDELPNSEYYHPWLSPNGLHLYFVKSRTAYFAQRPTAHSRFGAAQPVRGIPVAQVVPNNELLYATYSDDELTVWYTLSALNTCNDRLFYRTRSSDTATFGAERTIYLDNTANPFVDCTRGYLYALTFSQNRQEAYAMMQGVAAAAIVRFRATGVDSFAYAGYKRQANIGYRANQLLDNDLTLLTMGGNSTGPMGQFTRASAADTFGVARPVVIIAAFSSNGGPSNRPLDATYQPACRQLVTTESTPRQQDMYLYTNVTRSQVQQVAAPLAKAAFTLTPNPAHHTVRLTGLPPTATTAHIIDALGRTVQTSDLAPLTSNLSLTGLPPGLYTVRVGAATRRLVVE